MCPEARGVCFAGPIAAGKTTCARYFQHTCGYFYTRYSEVLASELEDLGIPVNRSTLQDYGLQVFHDLGGGGLTRLLLERVGDRSNLVVDGVRHISDVMSLRPEGMLIIYVDAPENVRRERYLHDIGNVTVGFDAASQHAVESEVPKLEDMADFVIVNDGTLDDLYAALGALVRRGDQPSKCDHRIAPRP